MFSEWSFVTVTLALLTLRCDVEAASGESEIKMANTKFTLEAKEAMLNLHKKDRSALMELGADIKPSLIWDEQLANLAQGLSNDCEFKHANTQLPNKDRVGQNLAWFSRSDPSTDNIMRIASGWANEKQWYDLGSATCNAPPRKSCGHYTQMIWGQTTKIGCGATNCRDTKLGGLLLVCNYFPPGNYVGKKPVAWKGGKPAEQKEEGGKPGKITSKPGKITSKPAKITSKPAKITSKPVKPTAKPAKPVSSMSQCKDKAVNCQFGWWCSGKSSALRRYQYMCKKTCQICITSKPAKPVSSTPQCKDKAFGCKYGGWCTKKKSHHRQYDIEYQSLCKKTCKIC